MSKKENWPHQIHIWQLEAGLRQVIKTLSQTAWSAQLLVVVSLKWFSSDPWYTLPPFSSFCLLKTSFVTGHSTGFWEVSLATHAPFVTTLTVNSCVIKLSSFIHAHLYFYSNLGLIVFCQFGSCPTKLTQDSESSDGNECAVNCHTHTSRLVWYYDLDMSWWSYLNCCTYRIATYPYIAYVHLIRAQLLGLKKRAF